MKIKRTGAGQDLWDGRHVDRNESIEVTEEQAKELLARPGWSDDKPKRKRTETKEAGTDGI